MAGMKPISFEGSMVRAILDGAKTMTRRVIKGFDPTEIAEMRERLGNCDDWWRHTSLNLPAKFREGDILYVKETWAEMPYGYVYRVDEEEPEGWDVDDRWRSSASMPKDASRIFLRVTKVSVERLQEISAEDRVREALMGLVPASASAFRRYWDNNVCNPANLKQYGWDANPWVWVISFERCDKP